MRWGNSVDAEPQREGTARAGRRRTASWLLWRLTAAAAIVVTTTASLGSAAGAANVTGVTVSPSPTSAGASNVTYTISFTTSATGALTPGVDTIDLAPDPSAPNVFPTFPSTPGDYTVQGTTATAVTASASGVTITVPVGVTIPANTLVTVVANGVTNPTAVGNQSLDVATSQDTTAASGTYSISPGSPQITLVTGNNQLAKVTTAYGSAFGVVVHDAFNNPISGASVSFTSPIVGPGGTFTGGSNTDTVTTDSSGVATSDKTFTANGSAGLFSVTASTAGALDATFVLTNTTVPGAPTSVTASGGNASAKVHWAPPTSNGFSPINVYLVTASNGTQYLAAGNATDFTVGGLTNNVSYTFQVAAVNADGVGPASAPTSPVRPEPGGYWLVARDGGIFSYGNSFYGSTGGMRLNAPIVGMASTPDGGGYWLLASDGGIFAFGDANFYGSMGGKPLNAPMIAIVSTSDGGGYWTVASDGGIFSYGDATYHGSMGGKPLNQPIVGMARTTTGAGYWLVARDGGIFAFGSARFFGSTGGQPLNQPIVGMSSPDASGYWLVASDGGIFAYGDAPFLGSTGGTRLNKPVVGMEAAHGGGYWLVASDGGIFSYGGATFMGSTGAMTLNQPIVGMAN